MSIERDQKLIDAISNGSKKALETVYVENEDNFHGFAYKYIRSKEDISDIYGDSIIVFWENVLDGKLVKLSSKISTYLFSIGKYKILNYINKDKRKTDREIDFDIKDIDDQIENFELEPKELNDEEVLLEKYFDQLGEQCKKILVLFYIKELRIKEIQKKENYKSSDVVKSMKSRCLKKLKEIIEREG
ncbi:sigma-70 family RNA polymerase sigma factor [Aquimarina sp. AD10]|uniref:RNA polymerase sigma factor n=1 Tax=Aquimarina sp. AD10 TaxID=1714849 RepID=UPI000E531EE6|nr:sigma-70 family RNA polymerase sigma factor [Aquimarina sp. AD10]AXT62113.1 sigma-70 family RNA polymerase sigma factor [Aquimarina sp. AD10]RKM99899.1 sigma-70 family RNA polymerase sigma factor [Aquimarina sp. AD10]